MMRFINVCDTDTAVCNVPERPEKHDISHIMRNILVLLEQNYKHKEKILVHTFYTLLCKQWLISVIPE